MVNGPGQGKQEGKVRACIEDGDQTGADWRSDWSDGKDCLDLGHALTRRWLENGRWELLN